MLLTIEIISNGSVAERSKAADSSSVIVRCACSNHAGVIIFSLCGRKGFFVFVSEDFPNHYSL